MRTITAVVMVLVAGGTTAFVQTESEIRDRIVGTWKLVLTEETLKDGTTRPYPDLGPRAKGFLMYQRDGYMCADLVNPDHSKWTDASRPTENEAIAAGKGTSAYCGRYEIDAAKRQIVHLPDVATNPGYVGSRQIRPYAFEDGRLVFSGTADDDPEVARRKIVWEKVQ